MSNSDIAKLVSTSDEWIVTRTGIKQRHIADRKTKTSDLGTSALKDAMSKCSMTANELDGIIVATSTPDMIFPATAVKIQKNIGMRPGFAFDIQAACSGFLYALQIADSFILQGKVQRIAVIGADIMSRIVNWKDKNTCVLFGDGAGALILNASHGIKNQGIISTEILSDGSLMNILTASGGLFNNDQGQNIHMNGQEVFRNAVRKMTQLTKSIINKNGKDIKEIDFLLLHQANQRIIKTVASMINIPDRKVLSSVQYHANTSSASIPLCLDHNISNGCLKQGDLIVSAAAGAGLTWSAALFHI